MTKVERFVVAAVAVGLAEVAYKRIVAAIEYDDCPCCFESAYPGLDDDAQVQGEVEAAIVCSQPRSPLFVEHRLPKASQDAQMALLALGEPRELYRREEWALEEFASRAA